MYKFVKILIILYFILQFSSFFFSYNVISRKSNFYNKLITFKKSSHQSFSNLYSKKDNKDFLCTECGTNYLQWEGKCKVCQSWNSIKEFKQSPVSVSSSSSLTSKKNKNWYGDSNNELILLSSITGRKAPKRIQTFSEEMNRVLGGGLVLGSVSLLAGEPGIGKSTLLLQLASSLSSLKDKNEEVKPKVVYLSGEESPEQLAMRSDRLGYPHSNLLVTSETRLPYLLANLNALLEESIEGENKEGEKKEIHPVLLIVDSIQTLSPTNENSLNSGLLTPGTPSAIRESAAQLIQWAKESGSIVLLAGHLTKTGEVAGPHLLEHMVDVILMLQSGGEMIDIKVKKKTKQIEEEKMNNKESNLPQDFKSGSLRILNSSKNRFGSTSEVGMLLMSQDGIEDIDEIGGNLLHNYYEKDVDNFNSNFTTYYQAPEGCSIISTFHGNRPLMTEVQCLVSPTSYSPDGFSYKTPKRWSIGGYPLSRLILLISVIEKRLHLLMNQHEVIINIASSSNKNINTNNMINSNNMVNGFQSRKNLYEDSLSDLPILLSLISSRLNLKIKPGLISFGEIGLGGELRGTNNKKNLENALKDITKWGIHKVLIPKTWKYSKKDINNFNNNKFLIEKKNNVEYVFCSNLKEAIEYSFDIVNFDLFLKDLKKKSKKRRNDNNNENYIVEEEENVPLESYYKKVESKNS